MIKKVVAILMFSSALAACATPYQSMGMLGGYKEQVISPNVYRITFLGNPATTPNLVQRYALRRAAELTLSKGYKYFIVIKGNDKTLERDVNAPPIMITETYRGVPYMNMLPGPSARAQDYQSDIIIKMFNNKNFAHAFDAAVLLRRISNKEESS